MDPKPQASAPSRLRRRALVAAFVLLTPPALFGGAWVIAHAVPKTRSYVPALRHVRTLAPATLAMELRAADADRPNDVLLPWVTAQEPAAIALWLLRPGAEPMELWTPAKEVASGVRPPGRYVFGPDGVLGRFDPEVHAWGGVTVLPDWPHGEYLVVLASAPDAARLTALAVDDVVKAARSGSDRLPGGVAIDVQRWVRP